MITVRACLTCASLALSSRMLTSSSFCIATTTSNRRKRTLVSLKSSSPSNGTAPLVKSRCAFSASTCDSKTSPVGRSRCSERFSLPVGSGHGLAAAIRVLTVRAAMSLSMFVALTFGATTNPLWAQTVQPPTAGAVPDPNAPDPNAPDPNAPDPNAQNPIAQDPNAQDPKVQDP